MRTIRLQLIIILVVLALSAIVSPVAAKTILGSYTKTQCYTRTALGVQQYRFCMTAKHTWDGWEVRCMGSPSFTFTPYQPGWSYTVNMKSCFTGGNFAESQVKLILHNGYNGLDGYDHIRIISDDDIYPPNWTINNWWELK